jgi:hypothetical protein
LIVDLEDILLLVKNFELENLIVEFRKSILFLEKLCDLFDWESDFGNTFGGNSAIKLHLVHLTLLLSVLFPVAGSLELLQSFNDVLGCLFIDLIFVGALHLSLIFMI